MTTGQYAAISTMAAMQSAQHAISNNFANVNTPGYKQDLPQTGQFNDILVTLLDVRLGLGNVDTTTQIVGSTGGGIELLPMLLDLTQGALRDTGRSLDVALVAPGFLVVRAADGTTQYMRGGSLRLGIDGTLLDQFGDSVLSAAGTPINLTSREFAINSDGSITADGGTVAQLAIVDLPAGEAWRKIGNNRFEPVNPAAAPAQVADPQARQGFLEQANVDTSQQFAEMLSVMRVFEAASGLLRLLDRTQAATATDIGSV